MLIKHNVDFGGYQAQEFKLHNTLTAPTGERGRMYFDLNDDLLKWHNGTAWIALPAIFSKPGDNVSDFVNDAGYLTSYTETDPVFLASVAAGILAGDIINWNNAFSWGDHSLAGYLTSFSETDTLDSVTTRGATTNNNLTVGGLVVQGNLTVSGTTTIVNTEVIELADNIITLNSNATGTPSEDGGIIIERGDQPNRGMKWNETSDTWQIQKSDGIYYDIATEEVIVNTYVTTINDTNTVTHNLNTQDVIVQMRDTVTNERYYGEWVATTTTTVDVTFYETPTNPIRVLILKIE